jgi:hypothetical protein
VWPTAGFFQILAVNWTVAFEDGGCTFYRGESEADGVVPVRVECDWKVDAKKAATLLGHEEGHAEIFSALAENTVLSDDGDIRSVYQVQRVRGISDRHVILDYTREKQPMQWRFNWSKAADQSGLRPEAVEVEVAEGAWEVTETETGMHLHYELRYLPGGQVPAFLIGWFQGIGTRQVIRDLRQSLVPFDLH